MTDALPIISQIKSILQLLFGQTSRALETQINFLDATPLLSQLKSLYEIFVQKNVIKATKTQHKFLIITNATINGIPLVGHIKGLGHYLIGDFKGGNDAMKKSSRTTVVILSGYFACTIFIPSTATMEATIAASAIGSMVGGLCMDTLITLIENVISKNGSLYGFYDKLWEVIKSPFDIGNLFDFIMGPILDGLIGAFIGFKLYQFRNLPPPPAATQTAPASAPPTHPDSAVVGYPTPEKLGVGAIGTQTINTLPPAPYVPPVSAPPVPPVNVLHPHIPLPMPFNPWDPRNIPIAKEALRYGAAASVIQKHTENYHDFK